jgi:hypothetical protein
LAPLVIKITANEKARSFASGLFRARSWYKTVCQAGETSPRKMKIMSADVKKSKTTAPKKEPAAESKTAEAAPKSDGGKSEGAKSEGVKSEAVKTEAAKPDAAPSKKGMGEGQKPVTQAYKDNWNAIFGTKKKKR